MTIELKPEQEQIIQEEMQSGHFRDPEEVLDCALAALREKRHSKAPRKKLVDVLSDPVFAGSELNLERIRDFPRPLDL
jgi:hypothetical protein